MHGDDALSAAEQVSLVLFGKGDPKALSPAALSQLEQEIPVFGLPGPGANLTASDIMRAATEGKDALFKSMGEAKRALEQGGLYINGERVASLDMELPNDRLLHGRYVLVRKGARSYGLVRVRS